MFGSGTKVRKADHADSWYSGDAKQLRAELQEYWDDALEKLDRDDTPPVRNARIIISPHAGFRFSGRTAAVAYRVLDIRPQTKNIFVIGPSHHVYLDKGTVSTCDELETPLGNLKVNTGICSNLAENEALFTTVSKSDEEAEHSLEMQYPWIKFAMDKALRSSDSPPTIVPIMAGNTDMTMEQKLGEALVPYLKDSRNLFVISSDFAHWGKRFRYTYYLPDGASHDSAGYDLRKQSQIQMSHPIHASIAHVDDLTMKAISSGTFELFKKVLHDTGNTVCGRHPIAIIMWTMHVLHKDLVVSENLSRFKFTDYTRSGLVQDVDDSSVSYASAYAKVECMNVKAFVKRASQSSDDEETDINEEQSQGSVFGVSLHGLSSADSESFGANVSDDVDTLVRPGHEPPPIMPRREPPQMFLGNFARYLGVRQQAGRSNDAGCGKFNVSQDSRVTSRGESSGAGMSLSGGDALSKGTSYKFEHPPCDTIHVSNLHHAVRKQQVVDLFTGLDGYSGTTFSYWPGGPLAWVQFLDSNYALRACEKYNGNPVTADLARNSKKGISVTFSKATRFPIKPGGTRNGNSVSQSRAMSQIAV